MTKSIFKTAAAICLILPLAGCDFMDLIEGKPTKAQIAHEQTQASIAALPAEPDIGALLAELPPTEPEPVEVAEAAPVVQPEPVVEPFECVSIFRRQTCEAGVLYLLDDQMQWILPGRTE